MIKNRNISKNLKWTKKNDDFLAANYPESSVEIISKCLDKPIHEVLRRVRDLKLKSKKTFN